MPNGQSSEVFGALPSRFLFAKLNCESLGSDGSMTRLAAKPARCRADHARLSTPEPDRDDGKPQAHLWQQRPIIPAVFGSDKLRMCTNLAVGSRGPQPRQKSVSIPGVNAVLRGEASAAPGGHSVRQVREVGLAVGVGIDRDVATSGEG